MVLGNTFHLFIQPGDELIAELGGLHEFMGWRGADHHRLRRLPGLLDGPRLGRRGDQAPPAERGESRILAIEEEGVRFRSYLDGAERFMGPETSMEIQAALGSDIALAFDECTPFHVERDYTARSMERTHRWLDRCVGLARASTRRPGRRSTGSCRAASTRTCARESAAYVAGRRRRRDRDRRLARRRQGADARGASAGRCATLPEAPPRHLLGIGDVDDIVHARRARASTRSTAPRRRAWAATAPRWCPTRTPAGGSTSPRPAAAEPRADRRGLPLPGLHASTRAATCTTSCAPAS